MPLDRGVSRRRFLGRMTTGAAIAATGAWPPEVADVALAPLSRA